MKKKNIIIISISIFSILAIGVSAFIYIKKQTKSEQEKEIIYNEYHPQFERLNLKLEDDIVLGCILDHTKKTSVCLNSLSRELEDLSLYPIYESDLLTYPEGFLLLKPTVGNIGLYDFSKREVFNKWIEYIESNEDNLFYNKADDDTHISLSSYIQWNLIAGEKEEEIKNILEEVNSDKYINIFPVKDSFRDKISNIEGISIEVLDQYYQVPYNYFQDVQGSSFEDIESLDSDSLVRLSLLSMGLQSLGEEDSADYEQRLTKYRELEEMVFEKYGLDRDEIFFITDYLPFDLIEYWELLYKGWNSTEREDFYSLIDIHCSEDGCLGNKLNILYEENED